MAQRYFRSSAKFLAVFCIALSFMSENFYYIAAIAVGIAASLYMMGHAEKFEYDRDRAYAILAFNDKAEFFCNLGWSGLILITLLLVNEFWLSPVKAQLLAQLIK